MRIFNFFFHFSFLRKNYFYFLSILFFFDYQEDEFRIFWIFFSLGFYFLAGISFNLFFFSIIEKSTFSNAWCEFLIFHFSSFRNNYFYFLSILIFFDYQENEFFELFIFFSRSFYFLELLLICFFSIIKKSTFSNAWCEFLIFSFFHFFSLRKNYFYFLSILIFFDYQEDEFQIIWMFFSLDFYFLVGITFNLFFFL